jgi:phospholipase A2
LFQEILLAEQWARLNHMPFPPVAKQVARFEKEPIKELYVFKDDNDEYCPVILHFVILNKTFKQFKAPGMLKSNAKYYIISSVSVR